MLNSAIRKGYTEKLQETSKIEGVKVCLSKSRKGNTQRTEGQPALLITDSGKWLETKELHQEIFGPATVIVLCASEEELLRCSEALEGTLTATIQAHLRRTGAAWPLDRHLGHESGKADLQRNPTGVEVGYAMHHGGPYPATTDAKFTSVGAAAIYRFARPICYQNFPEALLPPELQNANPRSIWRMVNGRLTRDPL